jgi:hypothetical protein
VEDYEELAMLQDAINSSQNNAWKKQAQRVLNNAVNTVTGNWDAARDWQKNSDANRTDGALQQVQEILIQKEN